MDMSIMENGLKQFFIDYNLSFNGGSKTLFKKTIVKKMLSVKLILNAELRKVTILVLQCYSFARGIPLAICIEMRTF